MKKQIAAALLPMMFALAACGGDDSAEDAVDTMDSTTTYDSSAVGETGATMTSPTDTTGAAGAGADTGAAAGGMADETANDTGSMTESTTQ